MVSFFPDVVDLGLTGLTTSNICAIHLSCSSLSFIFQKSSYISCLFFDNIFPAQFFVQPFFEPGISDSHGGKIGNFSLSLFIRFTAAFGSFFLILLFFFEFTLIFSVVATFSTIKFLRRSTCFSVFVSYFINFLATSLSLSFQFWYFN